MTEYCVQQYSRTNNWTTLFVSFQFTAQLPQYVSIFIILIFQPNIPMN